MRARGTSKHDAQAKAAHPLEVFGRYTIHEVLGEGGMAYVHRAERQGWQRNGVPIPIALKRLFPELSDDEQFVEGFLQEARLVKLLEHPNISRAYEHGKLDGTYYMAMEYVPGPTLRATMIQARTAAGAIPIRITVSILMQLVAALSHAHELRDEQGRPLNIVHRDVSPANIILSTTGPVKLIDFGIAKAAYSRVQTQVGFIKGKISYVAPEYTRGRLDHRADLFAVGVIAHEMLTNRRLFDGEDQVSVIHKVRGMPIQRPSHYDRNIPRDLDDIVMLALERDPAARWQNGAALYSALANVARQLGQPVTPAELRAWVEWAFAVEPARDSLGDMLDGLDRSVIAPMKTEAIDFDSVELIPPTPTPHRNVVKRETRVAQVVENVDATVPSALFDPSELLSKQRRSRSLLDERKIADEIDRQLGSERARDATEKDHLLVDGWSPPTGTAMVRAASAKALPLALHAVMVLVVLLGIAGLLMLWLH